MSSSQKPSPSRKKPPERYRLHLLKRSSLPVKTAALARYLIGKTLVRDLPRGRMAGRIVETEAYVPGDAAGHSFIGQTARNKSMFLERGHAYVYFIYGNWYSINVAGERKGIGGGVLLRALEPLEGLDLMKQNRRAAEDHALARGPGCLATALQIDRSLDGVDLCQKGLVWLAQPVKKVGMIGTSVRIGISREIHRPLRFFELGNPCVSGPKALNQIVQVSLGSS
jgi:DNA-3-methyladenine glycosylase